MNLASHSFRSSKFLQWGIVLASGFVILLLPRPAGITPESWHLLAIFVATIIGCIVRPLPDGAMVLIGISVVALSGALSIQQALGGYADPIVWMVLAAFFISRGMMKTGLGRRIAFLFIRAIGHSTLGLGYALVSTDLVLATVIPSTAARSGGIIFPIATSIADAYDSKPGPTANRIGAFLMKMIYQCEVILCTMFLTGQASNVLIAKFAKQTANIELSYSFWALAGIVPGLVSLFFVPRMLYRLFPPEIKQTPDAARLAATELEKMGPMSRNERLMLMVFGLVASLWITGSLHGINYAVVALLGISLLLLTGVLDWQDAISEKEGWGVFIWYGGLVRMAEALGETGIIKWFAEQAASMTVGWPWWWALAILLLIYFYAHYGFASITAHATAMYIPFLIVILSAGAPVYLAVLSLAFFSNLSAGLTHYGTTPAPIYFGAGYVTQGTWWRLGLIASLINIAIWVVVGGVWWKVLGLW
jgi:DASS family divalent anion:Na+ symporter